MALTVNDLKRVVVLRDAELARLRAALDTKDAEIDRLQKLIRLYVNPFVFDPDDESNDEDRCGRLGQG